MFETLQYVSNGTLPTFVYESTIKLGPVFRLSMPEWVPFVIVADASLARS